MTPLHVVAKLRGPIASRSMATMLDALLGWAIATRDGLPPPDRSGKNLPRLDIPIARDPTDRFYLATQSFATAERFEKRHKNRRFPLFDAMLVGGPKIKRINLQGGPNRSYRIDLPVAHLKDDELHWWAIGQRDAVEELLVTWVGFIGHRRGVGFGPVARWGVEPCEPWGNGFPVLRDGQPMRQIPLDTPGLRGHIESAYRVVDPPYWRRDDEELCAVPPW